MNRNMNVHCMWRVFRYANYTEYIPHSFNFKAFWDERVKAKFFKKNDDDVGGQIFSVDLDRVNFFTVWRGSPKHKDIRYIFIILPSGGHIAAEYLKRVDYHIAVDFLWANDPRRTDIL